MDDFKEEKRYLWPRRGDKLFSNEGENPASKACIGPYSGWEYYTMGYKKAAALLVQHVVDKRQNQDTLIYPAVFLYRHYIELLLKQIIKNGSMIISESCKIPHLHNPWDLWTVSKRIIMKAWPDGDKKELNIVEECIREISEIDPGSTTFRYPVKKTGGFPIPAERTRIDLQNLGEVMRRLGRFLEGCEAAISEIADSMFQQQSND